jgi:glycerol-3-phosphate dehydrogenase
MMSEEVYDLLVVGGGINGVGIARDAAGRGLSVMLVERDDLGAHTSSSSSKLIHGGLRYLEQYEFRLVAESLAEREVLLRAAPHLVRPMRFVMPHAPELRPAWMIRAGLFLYDYLARRQTLPGSHRVDLARPPYDAGLKPGLRTGFIYSDCRVDDARLVVANARAAADAGAVILSRTACMAARREDGMWRATLASAQGAQGMVRARGLINVAGPWAKQFLDDSLGLPSEFNLKLVQGSHIVVPRLYPGGHAFILQNDDRRVIFVYPYEGQYTLIGTTDVELKGSPGECAASPDEIAYLCRADYRYFVRELAPQDVVWSYCGVRPLFDDGSGNPSKITRDYVLQMNGDEHAPPLLSVFGGKITTYRKLAEHALERLAPWFQHMRGAWTDSAPLPGGQLTGGSVEACVAALTTRYPALPQGLLNALVDRHGEWAARVLGDVRGVADFGKYFGAGLYARELDYFLDCEWALTLDDILWRRTKAGLHMNIQQKHMVAEYIAHRVRPSVR